MRVAEGMHDVAQLVLGKAVSIMLVRVYQSCCWAEAVNSEVVCTLHVSKQLYRIMAR